MHYYAEQSLTLAKEHGFPHWEGLGLIYSGWSLTMLGQAREGTNLSAKGLSAVRGTGGVNTMPLALIQLAEMQAKLSQPTEGFKYLSEATQIMGTTGLRSVVAELHRVRGDLLDGTGDRAAAKEAYHQALTLANRQNAKTFELRAATSLARLWRDLGKCTEARDLLVPVYNWFTEGFDTPVLQEAKALLEALSA